MLVILFLLCTVILNETRLLFCLQKYIVLKIKEDIILTLSKFILLLFWVEIIC